MEAASMFSEKKRQESFKTKWKQLTGFRNCTPENFAKAGFYNCSTKESRDNVKCFVCMKQLDGWEKEDDPWEEHKKRGQNCLFVQLKTKNSGDSYKMRDVVHLYVEMMKNIVNEAQEKQLAPLQKSLDLIKGVKNGDLSVLDNI